MNSYARLATVLVAGVALLAAYDAAAYERAEVQGKSGTYLFWAQRNISYYVNKAACADVSLGEAMGAIKRAFFNWSAPSCTDLFFTPAGLVDTTKTNLTLPDGAKADLKNLIIWHEAKWPPEGTTDGTITKDMPAVTTLYYDTTTGVIIDADIDLNGYNFFWTTTDDGTKATTDIESILTHEIGHIIGLGHSSEPEATMFAKTSQAELKKRTLEKDDIAGVCFIYPYAGMTPTRPGEGTIKVDVQGGCTTAAAPRPPLAPGLLLLAPLLLLARRRRR